ncbi:hypothetical protein NQ315_006519 [Exocentrus adspersus]|uniref:Uncharacterized protein n=1 Tax=Exocentrus adspersus TaxID=1586481 RepID=A0AAV8W094_9CUCU|nr:hypothetical protein NQ315_006519 [Exocentrus adspersus]
MELIDFYYVNIHSLFISFIENKRHMAITLCVIYSKNLPSPSTATPPQIKPEKNTQLSLN